MLRILTELLGKCIVDFQSVVVDDLQETMSNVLITTCNSDMSRQPIKVNYMENSKDKGPRGTHFDRIFNRPSRPATSIFLDLDGWSLVLVLLVAETNPKSDAYPFCQLKHTPKRMESDGRVSQFMYTSN